MEYVGPTLDKYYHAAWEERVSFFFQKFQLKRKNIVYQ